MQAGAHANDLAGDSRSLLIAFADGACQLFSWQGQVTPLVPSSVQGACVVCVGMLPAMRLHPVLEAVSTSWKSSLGFHTHVKGVKYMLDEGWR